MSKSAQKQSARDKESDSATGGAGIHGVDLNNLKQELFLKIVVLGDLGVGKTSLVRTYTESGVVGGPGSAGSGSEGGGGYKVSFDAGYHLKRLEESVGVSLSKRSLLGLASKMGINATNPRIAKPSTFCSNLLEVLR